MRKTIIHTENLLKDEYATIEIDIPSKCPCCSIAYGETPLSSYFATDAGYSSEEAILLSIYFCPYCLNFFVVEYRVYTDDSPFIACQSCIYPESGSLSTFPPCIQNLSSKFVSIYNQAERAENSGLNEICGLGYRKALEFLIKDYSISLMPNSRSEIESSSLSQCISTYIDNEKIKALAKASAWIGNDETHYVKKHRNRNVQDLKRFINTVVAFIEYELNYAEALCFLSNPE